MIKLIGATAAIVFATSVAYAGCSDKHVAMSKPDPTTTASVTVEPRTKAALTDATASDTPVVEQQD